MCRALARRLRRPALPPPLWLRLEGIAVAVLGAGAIVVCGAAGTLAGFPSAQSAAAGAVAALALTLYLLVTRAGRILGAAVAALGIALALLVPQLTTDVTLAGRGERVQVVVTAVAVSQEDDEKYLCSVRYGDGTPVKRRLSRGCSAAVTPGSSIGMLYDPKGRLAPHGISPAGATWRLVAQGAALTAGLAVLAYLAVVRSIRRGA
ncbi:hypothetical protein [Streptomyces indicus]|uniref:DUF3592 domain-containing protein n=1 Tax=Streptomyces indicus TaxID=417292 RepID=A0A1G9ARH7_9ACTN|nr:hypothetical protein [Streptomyces indicus]SDK29972.1 hypothetical protein SAMN05421806_106116 [Streptomyces indicus]